MTLQQPAPKPFEMLPFAGKPKRDKKVGHEKFLVKSYSGKMQCLINVLSPLHVGTGLFELDSSEVYKAEASLNDSPILPGSSLKGVIRSIAEAISLSCVSKASKPRLLPDGDLRECGDPENLCVCCRIFGSLGYLGRVNFTDAGCLSGNIIKINVPSFYSPKESGLVYKRNGKFAGRKFFYHGQFNPGKEPIHAFSEDSKLRFLVNFENLDSNELCLLLSSMGILGGLKIKLGGGKPACLGSIQIIVKKFLIYNPKDSFLSFSPSLKIYDGETLRKFLSDISKSDNLINKNNFARLKAIWAFPSMRQCPSGLY